MQILLRSNVVDPRKAKARKERTAAAPKGDAASTGAAPSGARPSQRGLRNTKTPVAPSTPVADIKVDVRGEPDRLPSQTGDIEMGHMQQVGSIHGQTRKDDAPLLLQQVSQVLLFLYTLFFF